jgi:signal transduction histidine kinase
MVVVEVTDGGEGVPEELAAHIFDRGISGASSTGLGLALARALVEADGGRLELSSARPARFAVYLRVPRAEKPAGSPRPSTGVVR